MCEKDETKADRKFLCVVAHDDCFLFFVSKILNLNDDLNLQIVFFIFSMFIWVKKYFFLKLLCKLFGVKDVVSRTERPFFGLCEMLTFRMMIYFCCVIYLFSKLFVYGIDDFRECRTISFVIFNFKFVFVFIILIACRTVFDFLK